MATSKKTIAVVGATGNQGSAVVKTFLATPGWHVRALTRNPESSSAKTLVSQGADVVSADLDDESTLLTAFRGAHVIFATTQFFALTEHPNASEIVAEKYSGIPINEACFQHELQHGKNIISAAAQVLADEGRLENFVLSTLSHAARWSKGNLTHILHFDVKAAIEEHMRSQHPELAAKTSYLQVGFYMSNVWFPFLQPKKGTDGTFTFRWPPVSPDTVLPATDPPKDVGVFVKGLLKAPYGTVLLGESERITAQGLVDLWSKVTGESAKLESVGLEQAAQEIEAAMPGGWGLEMAEMMLYYRDYGYDGGDPAVKRPKDLGIGTNELTSYEEYLKSQDWSGIL